MDQGVTAGVDYRQFYHLEEHLFETVHARFQAEGELGAFDLFCIVIWKANRSKSKVASRLLSGASGDLDAVARRMTREVAQLSTARQRLECTLTKWNLRLPMATAILSVCYPEEFTVYDVRVCGMLGDFKNLGHLTAFDSIWSEYQRFVAAVRDAAPQNLTLRDKDRWLWGQSFSRQLERDIERGFGILERVET